MGEDWPDLPEHVAAYLYRRTVSCLPEGVLETLASLSPEELEVLERVGASLEASEADPMTWVCAVH